ncbi:MAG: copper chaperone PCu(A)C [Lautropia sp.]|nr:copper chaperone PCu(A)C [Lautropia sp.]
MKKTIAFSVSMLLAAPVLLYSAPAQAAGKASHTTLSHCVIQEVLPGKNMTGAFVNFRHTGQPVQVERVDVPDVSARAELHQMTMKDGVMEMGPLQDTTLKAGERVFRKGGDHIMLFDIASRPRLGSKHTLTAFFSDGTQASCKAVVASVKSVMKGAGMSGRDHGMHGHHMHADEHQHMDHHDMGHSSDGK